MLKEVCQAEHIVISDKMKTLYKGMKNTGNGNHYYMSKSMRF